PKDIETCPECGGKVGKNRGGHAGEIIQTRLKQPHPRFTNRLERRLVRSSFGRGPQSRLHNSPDHILSIPYRRRRELESSWAEDICDDARPLLLGLSLARV